MARKRKLRGMPCELTANPFYILGVSTRSTADEIAAAYQASLAVGEWPEDLIHQAHQHLTQLEARLDAELRWLPGLSHQEAMLVAERLAGRRWVRDEWWRIGGLDAANYYADLCYRGGGNDLRDRHAVRLTLAYRAFDEEAVIGVLTRSRAEAGFPAPDHAVVRQGLLKLRHEHAKAALDGCTAARQTNYRLLGWTKDFRERKEHDIIEDIVREYIASEEPALTVLRDSALAAIARLHEDAGASSAVEEIKQALIHWRRHMEPLQNIAAARGSDEPRSMELYGELRKLYTGLLEKGLHRDLAMKLMEVAQSRFNFLPTASREIGVALRSAGAAVRS